MPVPTYQLHHLCIYEKNPRDAMWNWLKWYHAIPAYYWEGYADMHHTGEGGVDYTFLACGCLLYTSPSPRDKRQSRMPSSA